jgi:hypothetical protein
VASARAERTACFPKPKSELRPCRHQKKASTAKTRHRYSRRAIDSASLRMNFTHEVHNEKADECLDISTPSAIVSRAATRLGCLTEHGRVARSAARPAELGRGDGRRSTGGRPRAAEKDSRRSSGGRRHGASDRSDAPPGRASGWTGGRADALMKHLRSYVGRAKAAGDLADGRPVRGAAEKESRRGVAGRASDHPDAIGSQGLRTSLSSLTPPGARRYQRLSRWRRQIAVL